MKVIVTGGCGFIGSNLVKALLKSKYEVLVIDNLITGDKNNCNIDANYIFEDYIKVLKKPEEYNINGSEYDVIFHLAAMPRIQPSFEKPLYTVENNVYGTAVVCEYARNNNIKVVYAGSSTFYGGVYLNPYSFTKWQGEEICKMYSSIYNTSTCIARFFNVYGANHLKDGPYSTVIGVFEKQYEEKKSLTITGDGTQERDFAHVDDICRALIKMSSSEFSGQVFDLGAGKSYSINDLANMFADSEIKYLPGRTGEAKKTLADISETVKILEWEPKENLEDYIRNFIRKLDR